MKFAQYRIPFKISLVYFLVGGAWILASDLLVSALFKDPSVITRLEIFKGWLFSLYPTTHAMEHPRYSFTLVGFVPAG